MNVINVENIQLLLIDHKMWTGFFPVSNSTLRQYIPEKEEENREDKYYEETTNLSVWWLMCWIKVQEVERSIGE